MYGYWFCLGRYGRVRVRDIGDGNPDRVCHYGAREGFSMSVIFGVMSLGAASL